MPGAHFPCMKTTPTFPAVCAAAHRGHPIAAPPRTSRSRRPMRLPRAALMPFSAGHGLLKHTTRPWELSERRSIGANRERPPAEPRPVTDGGSAPVGREAYHTIDSDHAFAGLSHDQRVDLGFEHRWDRNIREARECGDRFGKSGDVAAQPAAISLENGETADLVDHPAGFRYRNGRHSHCIIAVDLCKRAAHADRDHGSGLRVEAIADQHLADPALHRLYEHARDRGVWVTASGRGDEAAGTVPEIGRGRDIQRDAAGIGLVRDVL